MTSRQKIDRSVLWILAFGFGLTILFLVASGFVGIKGMKRAEAEGAALVAKQQISTKLINEIHREEASLSSLFYQLAASPEADRERLRQQLLQIESEVKATLRSAGAPDTSPRWQKIRTTVESFMEEVLRCLDAPGHSLSISPGLYRMHESLLQDLADLVTANYAEAVDAQQQNHRNSRQLLRRSLILLVVGLLLSGVCATATVRIAARILRRAEWQAQELSRLSGHVLDSQEDIVRRFSRELHDELGQTLTAIEANLSAIAPASAAQEGRLEDCQLLVKDAISAVREMSQLLRPSMLDDFGLSPALQFLAESFSQRTGINVEADIRSEHRLSQAAETHLFRVAQEALTNCARHAGATRIVVSLEQRGDRVRLTISDNGRGFAAVRRTKGFGLIGMRERMHTLGGDVDIRSTPQGVTIIAEAPVERVHQNVPDSSLVG